MKKEELQAEIDWVKHKHEITLDIADSYLKEIECLQKQLSELEPKYKKGSVYEYRNNIVYCTKDSDRLYGYGIIRSSNWADDNKEPWTDIFELSTIEKWESRLIQYAKEKGFKEGVFLKQEGINKYFTHVKDKPINDKFNYYINIDTLDSSNGQGRIYRQGQWATIVEEKEEPIDFREDKSYDFEVTGVGSFKLNFGSLSIGKYKILKIEE